MKARKVLNISAPIGDNPPQDAELRKRISELGDAPITVIFQEINRWEKEAVSEDRRYENTRLTGRLTTACR